jgi:hypothetical protein
MSLIVDINPVPWKILDLVQARILKNRAKKSKKGMGWSKETLRREMSQQQAPLISRRKDEPSFTLSPNATFIIEGSMRYIDSPYGPQSDLNPYPIPYLYQESWRAYRKNEDDEFPVYFTNNYGFLFPGDSTFSFFSSAYKNPRDFKSKYYVSFFRADSGEYKSLSFFMATGTAEARSLGGSQYQTHKKGYVTTFLADLVPGIRDIPINDEVNPLYAWPEKLTTTTFPTNYYATVNNNPPHVSSQDPCPVEPEFDESRISKIPGYIQTRSFDFTGYPQISGVTQTQVITVEL